MMIKAFSSQRLAGARVARHKSLSLCQLPRRLPVATAGADEGASTSSPSTPPPAPEAPAKYTRTFRALGSEVIESNVAFEEPPPKDMWEGENFESMGQFLERYFVPFLLVLGLICGGFAASTYNQDADVFIKPASGPDELPIAVPASAIQQAPSLSS